MWSDYVNGVVYQFVGLVLQASQVHNIAIEGCAKYNAPSGNVTLTGTGSPSSPTLTSYSLAAIIGADDFVDSNATMKDLFDTIVNVTRQITPTCAFPRDIFASALSLTRSLYSWHRLESRVRKE